VTWEDQFIFLRSSGVRDFRGLSSRSVRLITLAEAAAAAAAAAATLLLTTKLLTSPGCTCNGYIKKFKFKFKFKFKKHQGPGNNRRCCINVVALMMSVDDV